jgi:hypothetical protein
MLPDHWSHVTPKGLALDAAEGHHLSCNGWIVILNPQKPNSNIQPIYTLFGY